MANVFSYWPVLAVLLLTPSLASAADDDQTLVLPKSVPFTFRADGQPPAEASGEFAFNNDNARWTPPAEFATSYMRLRNLSAELDEHKFTVRCKFKFRGSKDPHRYVCAEMRLLDEDGKLLFHTWQICHDARIGPRQIPMGSLMRTRSIENSPWLLVKGRTLRQVLPCLARAEIRLWELHEEDRAHFPRHPSSMRLAVTRPDDEGRFEVSFANPIGWDLEPAKHQIAFQLFVRDADGKTIRADRRFLDYRADGRYRESVQVEPVCYDHSVVSLTVFTRQPDNDKFIHDFFIGGSSGYHGIWTGDHGKLIELPLEGGPLFDDLPEPAVLAADGSDGESTTGASPSRSGP